jgi:DNA-binding GntR family transcriptional regulator
MSSPSPNKLKRSANTAEQAFQRLVEAIFQGQLITGQPLREAALARTWKVGRTPLREAVRRAAENGLVVLRPNQAPLIRPISIEEVRSFYDLRELLELYALRSAWASLPGPRVATMAALADRVAPDRPGWQKRSLKYDLLLHHWWAKHCGNPWLQTDLMRHYQFLRIFQRWMGRDPGALLKGYYEHLDILKAIKDRNLPGAVAALRNHIRQSAQLVIAALRDSAE